MSFAENALSNLVAFLAGAFLLWLLSRVKHNLSLARQKGTFTAELAVLILGLGAIGIWLANLCILIIKTEPLTRIDVAKIAFWTTISVLAFGYWLAILGEYLGKQMVRSLTKRLDLAKQTTELSAESQAANQNKNS